MAGDWRDTGSQLLLLATMLLAWEAAVSFGVISAFWVSTPL